ncbi:MAG: urease accessory protein UreE [Pseudomonadota bacterium]
MRRALELQRAGSSAPPPSDRVTLDYDARYRRRGMLVTGTGERILLDLAQTTELGHGDLLLLEDGDTLEVVAAAERLTAVSAPEGVPLARFAWHIGNRHTPCAVEADRLLIRHDHVLEEMLRGLGARLLPIEAPFLPEGGAYGHGRTHGHHHGHDPHADPNAHIPHRHG